MVPVAVFGVARKAEQPFALSLSSKEAEHGVASSEIPHEGVELLFFRTRVQKE